MSNPVSLRDYQYKLADDIRGAYAGGHRAPLVRLDTGGGKTRLFTYVAWGANTKKKEVVAVAHRKELIEQISMTFASFGIEHRVIAPPATVRQIKISHFRALGKSFVLPSARAAVASVQTLVRNLTCVNPDIIIIDESHHLTETSQWGQVVAAFPMAKLLPVTATPIRLDGKGLGVNTGGFADVMLQGPPMRWLIDNGYLSDYRIFAPPVEAQTSGFHTKFGDFAKKEISDEYAKPKIIGNAIEHYLKIARGLPCMTFCASVDNAELTAEEYRAAGIMAFSVDGSMDDSERSKRIKGLADGSVEVLTSADLVGEGLDIPGIMVTQFLRPTQSLSLCMQQAGRGLRPIEGKTHAIILDHVGNIMRHGLPDDEREWSLDGVVKKRRGANDDQPDVSIKTCPMCFAIHLPAPECPACGHKYAPAGRTGPKQEEGQLVELTAAAKEQMRRAAELEKLKAKKKRTSEERQCETLEDLIELGKSRGYQYPKQWGERRLAFIESARQKRTG